MIYAASFKALQTHGEDEAILLQLVMFALQIYESCVSY